MKLVFLLAILSLIACGADVDVDADVEDVLIINTNNDEEEPDDGTTPVEKCVSIVACNEKCGMIDDGCDGELDCGVCIDEERLEELAKLVDSYAEQMSGLSFLNSVTSFDQIALNLETREIIRGFDAGDDGLIAALRNVMFKTRIGHHAFYNNKTYSCVGIGESGDGGVSRHGACAVSHPEGFLITNTLEENSLGLSAGDMVTSINGNTGEDLVRWSLNRPVCGGGAASDQALLEEAARSVFSSLVEGSKLTIRNPLGMERQVVVGKSLPKRSWLSCRDPLGRETNIQAESYLRDDGVGVIRLPSFFPIQGFDENGNIALQIEMLKTKIFEHFEPLQDAKALIWDVRSNVGGVSIIGFAIAGGMRGLQEVELARCTGKLPNSVPERFYRTGPDYDLAADPQFEFAGAVAVLIDGNTLSAGDYFALAVKKGTEAILVGTPTSGAFGGSGATIPLSEEFNLVGNYDPSRCNDLDGEPLETRGVEPDIWVQYDAGDLAEGRDTIMERAASELLK